MLSHVIRPVTDAVVSPSNDRKKTSITAKSHTKNSRRICLVQPAGVFGKVSQNLLLIDFHLGAVVAHCHDVVGIGGEEDVGVFR